MKKIQISRQKRFFSEKVGPMKIAVGNTALWVCAIRANESKNPNPLFVDNLAEIFGGQDAQNISKHYQDSFVERWYLPKEVFSKVQRDIILIRHKYFDDYLLEQNNSGCKQGIL
jgi:O-methyltransferase involved in polyketide biosynthesis